MVNIIKRFSRSKTQSAKTSSTKSSASIFNSEASNIEAVMPSSPYNGGKKRSRVLIDEYELDSENEELEGPLSAYKLKINLTKK